MRLRFRVAAFVLAAVLAGCGGSPTSLPPPAGQTPRSSPSPSPITQPQAVTIAGTMRTYLLYRPPLLDTTKPVPLVIALHGYTVDARWMELVTNFDAQATKNGFVVVYPEGVGKSWNAGTCCGVAQSEHLDDVAFMRVLIDRLVKSGQIDRRRVFVAGLSNGGMMAHRLACELADRIAAVASVSGALGITNCRPTRPISVLEMHGTLDTEVPLAGGYTSGIGRLPPTMSFMNQWAALEGCANHPTTTQVGVTRTITWPRCRAGETVVLDEVVGAGHAWFGPSDDPAEPDATSTAWDFFSHAPALR